MEWIEWMNRDGIDIEIPEVTVCQHPYILYLIALPSTHWQSPYPFQFDVQYHVYVFVSSVGPGVGLSVGLFVGPVGDGVSPFGFAVGVGVFDVVPSYSCQQLSKSVNDQRGDDCIDDSISSHTSSCVYTGWNWYAPRYLPIIIIQY